MRIPTGHCETATNKAFATTKTIDAAVDGERCSARGRGGRRVYLYLDRLLGRGVARVPCLASLRHCRRAIQVYLAAIPHLLVRAVVYHVDCPAPWPRPTLPAGTGRGYMGTWGAHIFHCIGQRAFSSDLPKAGRKMPRLNYCAHRTYTVGAVYRHGRPGANTISTHVRSASASISSHTCLLEQSGSLENP